MTDADATMMPGALRKGKSVVQQSTSWCCGWNAEARRRFGRRESTPRDVQYA